MAYNSNGKVHTDNPLMDEICYNCKRILNGIVVKNDILANNYETVNSIQNQEVLFMQKENGSVPFSIFPFTIDMLVAFGYSEEDAAIYVEDRNKIPVSDRSALTSFANEYFKENFEEENNYYRALMGLPPFNTGEEFYLYIDPTYIPSRITDVDYTLPIHEQPENILSVLYSTGGIDRLKKDHVGSNYSYLNYLGAKAIDLYSARKANKWDILYIPSTYYLVNDRFVELFRINRELYLSNYQQSFADTGVYYDQIMIINLLAETFANMIAEIPEWLIRRDIFDTRSIQYFFESYGITGEFDKIPLKYQIRIVKNLNKLIKFKASNKNLYDIVSIFGKENVTIYKYWLLKKRLTNPDGSYVDGTTDEEKYELEFVKSELEHSFDDYIKDPLNRVPYDDITYSDVYWDGEDTHEYIKQEILKKDFTIEDSKYISIDYQASMSESEFQMSYFLGLVLNSKLDFIDVRIPVASIDPTIDFAISDLFLYTVILSESTHITSDNDHTLDVRKPSKISEGEPGSVVDEPTGLKYDWRQKNTPEIYAYKTGRVNSFNLNVDIEAIKDEIRKRRHIHFQFGKSDTDYYEGNDKPYTDEEYEAMVEASGIFDDLGISSFIIPDSEIESIEELVTVYNENKNSYEKLLKAINDCDNEDDYSLYTYILQEMYTMPFDMDFITLQNGQVASTLVNILMERNYILYNHYYNILSDNNQESRNDLIRNVLNDIVDTLQYYLNYDGLEYLFSFTPIDGFGNIVYYIWTMMNFFKSYKISLLDPTMTITTDNQLSVDNNIFVRDKIASFTTSIEKFDRQAVTDYANFKYESVMKDKEGLNFKESAYIFQHKTFDPLEDLDYNGLNAEDGEAEGYKDLDGGIADESQNVPYRDLDAGRSYLGMVDYNNLDGSNADEAGKEYVELDGGDAYILDDEKTDWFGSQGFNANLDGGGANNLFFKSQSTTINVKGRRVNIDINISSRTQDYLYVEEDGLYAIPIGVDGDDLQILMDDISRLKDDITSGGEGIIVIIHSLSSWDDIVELLGRYINKYTYVIEDTYNKIFNDIELDYIKDIADTELEYIQNLYANANPYGWQEL